MEYFEVKNFSKYQHYKDRCPPWIKLHISILTDPDFLGLPDESKFHLILIYLIASNQNNIIPFDVNYLKTVTHINGNIDLDILLTAGFIKKIKKTKRKQSASKLQAGASKALARDRGETETEERRVIECINGRFTPIDDDELDEWKRKYPDVDIEFELEGLAEWWEENPAKVKSRKDARYTIKKNLRRKQKEISDKTRSQNTTGSSIYDQAVRKRDESA